VRVGSVLTFTDTKLQLLHNYYYRVAAVSSIEGQISNEACSRAFPWLAALGCP